jgi:murein DD-endopeptidase MepM/ murein hydrolase activator NlpD
MGNSGQEAVTYDGHEGIDFELPSFRPMDNGFPVLAAADGVVEETFDQAPDRNRTCVKEKGNHVRLRHANGFATIYEHLRRDSIVVRVGASVSAGMPLGLVGSSGCSSFPHLHLEVRDCQGHALDVMSKRMFEAPPVYARSMSATVMEISLFQPAINDMLNVMEPGTTDLNQITVGYEASIGVTVANMKAGDAIRIEFLNPNNALAPFVFEQQLSNFHARTHWWYNFQFDRPGRWLARISLNGRVQMDRPILAM